MMEIHENESELVDLGPLRNLLGNNEEGIAKILNIFISQIPPSIVEIKSLLEKQDWDALRKKVHSIKSYYGYVGNDKLNHTLDEWDAPLARSHPDIDHKGTIAQFELKSESILHRIHQLLLTNP